jgi:hypothetical protein
MADKEQMDRIDGGAVSANLLGEACIPTAPAVGTSGVLVMALKMCNRKWCFLRGI